MPGMPQLNQLVDGWFNPNESDYQNAVDVSNRQTGILNQYGAAPTDPTSMASISQLNSGNEGGGTAMPTQDMSGINPSTAGTPGAYTLNQGYDTSSLNASSLPDKYYIGNYGDANPSAQSDAQATLDRIKKYDPNASMSLVGDPTDYGSSGDSGASQGSYYQLKYDSSKLPKQTSPSNANRLVTSNEDLHNTTNAAMNLDPNYGVFTSPENVYQKPGLMDQLGAALPAVAGLAFGVPMLNTVMGGMGTLENLGNGGSLNPLSLAGSALSFIPGMGSIADSTGLSSIMPYINAARAAYGASKGNIGSIANLARLGYSGLGGH